MNSTEAATKNGRNLTKNAELAAVPAANIKGSSGRQQLDANTTVPRAAMLAKAVLFDLDLLFCPSSVIVGVILLSHLQKVQDMWRSAQETLSPLNASNDRLIVLNALLIAECNHRIDFGCASGREVTGHQRNHK